MRPIGKRIREVCAILEAAAAPMSYMQVHEQMPIDDSLNSYKYCMRAARRGMVSVDKSSKPMRFSIIAGWRDKTGDKSRKLAVRKREKPAPADPKTLVNSVFNLAK